MKFFALLPRFPLALVLIWYLMGFQVACIHATVRTRAHAVSTGTWGGDHVVLEVTKGGAEVEFDCAHGQITQPMTLDRKGNFGLKGTFSPEHGGPVRNDESDSANQVRYTGHVNGKIMTLTVVLEKDRLGPFTLAYERQPNLMKCR
jgi:hypothetical protein